MLNKTITFNQQSCQSGFTLIELILYVALIAIFISAAILFTWDIIFGQAKAETINMVNHELRFVSQRIAYEIRNAQSIDQVIGSQLHLRVSDASRNPTVILLEDGQIKIGFGTSSNCPISSPCSLTSNQVQVDELNFVDLSSGNESHNVSFNLTISSQGDKKEWQWKQSYRGTAEIRSN